MPTLVRDLETRSQLRLDKVGVHRYATDPSTKVLCMAYCVDAGPIKLWHPGDAVPPEFNEAAHNPQWRAVAHNAAFEMTIEQHIMHPRHNFLLIPLERNICTMAAALAMALPGKLEVCAQALNLTERKDVVGHRAMLQVTKPRRARKNEDPDEVHWYDDEVRLERVDHYCMQDVSTERELLNKLYLLSPDEFELWMLDQRINNRGFCIDYKLALAANRIVEEMYPRLDQELCELTDGNVQTVNQVAQMKKWLAVHCGTIVDDLDKETVELLLNTVENKKVRRLLELRQLGAHASVKKIKAFLMRRCADGRVRGEFQFHAAGTGRFSSRGIQVHNLKRLPDNFDYTAAIKIIEQGDYKLAAKAYPNPLETIGMLMRPLIIAKKGYELWGADFSGIEARVTAWLAGEESKLDVFRKYDAGEGPDPYIVTAAKILVKPVEQISKQDRQLYGKPPELAFGFQGGVNAFRKFATAEFSNEEIEKFRDTWRNAHPKIRKFWYDLNDCFWDAAHQPGVPYTANKKITIQYDVETFSLPIIWMTLPSGRQLAYPGISIRRATRIEQPDGEIIERGRGVYFKDNSMGRWRDVRMYGGLACLGAAAEVLTTAGWKQINKIQIDDLVWDGIEWVEHEGVIHRGTRKTALLDGVPMTADHEVLTEHGWVRAAQAQKLHRAKVRLPDSSEGCGFDGKRAYLGTTMSLWKSNTPSERRFCQRESSFLRLHALDISRRRYAYTRDEQAPGLLCLALNEGPLFELEASCLKKLWWAWHHDLQTLARKLRKFLEGYGFNLQARARTGPHQQQQRIFEEQLSLGYTNNQYAQSTHQCLSDYSLGPNDTGRSGATFGHWSNDNQLSTKTWLAKKSAIRQARCYEPTYDILNCGPWHRFVVRGQNEPFIVHNCENCVQAVARDLLAEAMKRLDAAGFEVTGHVHDEVFCEERKGSNRFKLFTQIMNELPEWAQGLPVVAKPWRDTRYVK